MLPLVIVNPASAGGATGGEWPGVAADLRAQFGPFACAFTEGPGDGRAIAEREARSGRRFVIACGGDGTISEVAAGLLAAGADAELGVLPSGTGGDFRRTLDIPARTRDAALALRRGKTARIDAGRVTFTPAVVAGGEGGAEVLRRSDVAEASRYFVNVASFGMGGAVIERVKSSRSSWLPSGPSRLFGGRASFAAAALRTAVTFEKPTVAVRLDDGPEARLTVANLCVANARYFGGGMKIAPEAKLDDGRFDVVAVGDLSAAEILLNSYRVYLGTHLGLREVRHARAQKVTLRAVSGGADARLEVDGELSGRL
ncbi:MAG TPA: diacylglycerol kinase family protein, partial [Pyrinomonadaceae bacterium]|nr:diacylglycerol kinase family protein [Pyrinomonadaceae bacterium]